MTEINWAKIGIVGGIIAVAAGGVAGNVLSDGQTDQVVAWADAGKGALTAVLGVIGTFVAALLAARKK